MNRGMTLPAVLFALALTSALAVGGAYVTRQIASVARTEERGALLEPLTERALVDVIASWDSVARAQQPVGATTEMAPSVTPHVRTTAWITRISPSSFWLVAASFDDRPPTLRRRIGVVVRVAHGAPGLVPERAWHELP